MCVRDTCRGRRLQLLLLKRAVQPLQDRKKTKVQPGTPETNVQAQRQGPKLLLLPCIGVFSHRDCSPVSALRRNPFNKGTKRERKKTQSEAARLSN